MTTPADPNVAAAVRELAAVIARLNLRLDAIAAIAADVRLLREIADAERQADGRASFPQPPGYVSRTR